MDLILDMGKPPSESLLRHENDDDGGDDVNGDGGDDVNDDGGDVLYMMLSVSVTKKWPGRLDPPLVGKKFSNNCSQFFLIFLLFLLMVMVMMTWWSWTFSRQAKQSQEIISAMELLEVSF